MSILDFTTDLFRDPASLRAFIEDADRSLRDAGLPDATAEQVYDLLPMVAESMPQEHPLQTVVHAPDPQAALQELDLDRVIEDLESDAHLQGKVRAEGEMDAGLADKAGAQARVGHHAEGAGDGDRIVIVESVQPGKSLGDATDTDDRFGPGALHHDRRRPVDTRDRGRRRGARRGPCRRRRGR